MCQMPVHHICRGKDQDYRLEIGQKLCMHVHEEVGWGTSEGESKRFIDDGFGIWTGSEEELKEFAVFANLIHGNIKVELR